MNDSPEGWRVQLLVGIVLLAMVAGATAADIVNNFLYGWAISGMAALVLVIAAFAVPAIPAVAKARGWCMLKRAAAAVAVAMTVYAAYAAYSTGQGNTSLASQTVNEAYQKAKVKEERANGVLSKVEEVEKQSGLLGSAKELGAITAQADARLTGAAKALTDAGKTMADAVKAAEKACKRPSSDACTLAKGDKTAAETAKKAAEAAKTVADGEAKAAHERLSLAEARDMAKAEPRRR